MKDLRRAMEASWSKFPWRPHQCAISHTSLCFCVNQAAEHEEVAWWKQPQPECILHDTE